MSAERIGSIGEAVGFGTIVGVGYLSATAMNMAINPNISRPILYGLPAPPISWFRASSSA